MKAWSVKKYVYRDKKGELMPYAERNNGLFELKECINDKSNWSDTQILITPKGIETNAGIASTRSTCCYAN